MEGQALRELLGEWPPSLALLAPPQAGRPNGLWMATDAPWLAHRGSRFARFHMKCQVSSSR